MAAQQTETLKAQAVVPNLAGLVFAYVEIVASEKIIDCWMAAC